jgi:hypothetical protein
MTSVGKVYMMDAFAGQELSASDFEGPCMLGEISGSLKAIAATGTFLYFGILPYNFLTDAATSPMGMGITSLLCPGFGYGWGHVSDYVLEKSDILPSSISSKAQRPPVTLAVRAPLLRSRWVSRAGVDLCLVGA